MSRAENLKLDTLEWKANVRTERWRTSDPCLSSVSVVVDRLNEDQEIGK